MVLMTYLVAKWIEKHHPQKQYSLVIKKGLNFVTSHATDYQLLVQECQQYLQ